MHPAVTETVSFVAKVNSLILFPLIALLSGIALLVFIYGSAEYVFGAANETARSTGKKHILFGIIGLIVMLSAFAILSLAGNTFGIGQQLNCADNPSASGCSEVFRINLED